MVSRSPGRAASPAGTRAWVPAARRAGPAAASARAPGVLRARGDRGGRLISTPPGDKNTAETLQGTRSQMQHIFSAALFRGWWHVADSLGAVYVRCGRRLRRLGVCDTSCREIQLPWTTALVGIAAEPKQMCDSMRRTAELWPVRPPAEGPERGDPLAAALLQLGAPPEEVQALLGLGEVRWDGPEEMTHSNAGLVGSLQAFASEGTSLCKVPRL